MQSDASLPQIVVVGAGPAGMMAALAAAGVCGTPPGDSAASAPPARVLLVEREARGGRKLLASGGGRCNLTNALPVEDFARRFDHAIPRGGESDGRALRAGRFVQPALRAFRPIELRRYFAGAGVATVAEDKFHYFPKSRRASDVVAALERELAAAGVETRRGTGIAGLRVKNGSVCGIDTDEGPIETERVILATGGPAWPALGGNASGMEAAREAGHRVVEPVPALVPLVTEEAWPKACAGIALPTARLRLDTARGRGAWQQGALLFTHRGISGPLVLNASGDVAVLLAARGRTVVRVGLVPEGDVGAWVRRIDAWRATDPCRAIHSLLGQYLPMGLARQTAAAAGADAVRAAQVTREQRQRLVDLLCEAPLTITATEGMAQAMVTRGGVELAEVNSRTMESRLVRGLYFAGEILDVDGPCGGFNLQWAFSSGRMAGLSARRGCNPESND